MRPLGNCDWQLLKYRRCGLVCANVGWVMSSSATKMLESYKRAVPFPPEEGSAEPMVDLEMGGAAEKGGGSVSRAHAHALQI